MKTGSATKIKYLELPDVVLQKVIKPGLSKNSNAYVIGRKSFYNLAKQLILISNLTKYIHKWFDRIDQER